MNDYYYRINRQREIEAWNEWVVNIMCNCEYKVTLQSNLKTANSSKFLIERKVSDLSKNLSYLRFRLNKCLVGRRDPIDDATVPLLMPVIEGRLDSYSKGMTLHVHAGLGNLPAGTSVEAIRANILKIWGNSNFGVPDIEIESLEGIKSEEGWSSYILKEMKLGNFEVVDLKNLQGPQHIVRDK
jgi:hypothetical protein